MVVGQRYQFFFFFSFLSLTGRLEGVGGREEKGTGEAGVGVGGEGGKGMRWGGGGHKTLCHIVSVS